MSSAAKIGLFMLIILGVIGYFVLKIEDVDLSRGKKNAAGQSRLRQRRGPR